MENEKLKIKYYKIKDINPAKYNPREISEIAFAGLQESLRKFGFVDPLVVNVKAEKNVLVGGHQRLKAAHTLGFEEVPVVEVSLSPAEEKALNISLNNSHISGSYTQDTLQELLKEIETDLGSTYLAELRLDELVIPEATIIEGQTDEDETPEPKKQISVVGDIYELGCHRLVCGDSTSVDAIEKLMGDEKADVVFTDPPYGMFLEADFSSMSSKFKGSKGGKKYDNVKGDHADFSQELINTVFANFSYCKEIFLWGADYYAETIQDKNKGSWIVWDKRGDESADKMFGSTFELCWSKNRHKREIARVKWAGIFGMEKEHDKKRVHPTQKPVELVNWFFEKWIKEGAKVVDLFGGSGSTLIACEKTKRKAYLMELDPHYVDVIVTRYCAFTGNKKIKRNGEEIEWEI